MIKSERAKEGPALRPACAVVVLVLAASCAGSQAAAGDAKPRTCGRTALPSDGAKSWCDCTDLRDGFELICIDAHEAPRIIALPQATLLQPNAGVAVKVNTLASSPPKVELDGEIGTLVPPTVRAQPSGSRADGGDGTNDQATHGGAALPDEAILYAFSPRKTGLVKLTVKPHDGEPLEQTLIVTERYSAALRLGLGLVWGGAVKPTYEARLAPGSQTQMIEESDRGRAAMELVVGAAPFLFDWRRGGRSYVGSRRLRDNLAPFVGLGAISADASGLEAFKSVYLGLEYELSPGISLAGTAVARRVKVLRDGVAVGSPTMSDQVPLADSFGLGFAFVLNATPDVFRFIKE
jgi:hypothetical protein